MGSFNIVVITLQYSTSAFRAREAEQSGLGRFPRSLRYDMTC